MREPVTTSLIVELLPDLLTAFPSKLSSQNLTHTAEVYRNGLRGLDGDAVRAAVDISIKTDTYFPKIARLRELASEWTKRNRATATPNIEAAWNICPVCGARAEQIAITRAVRSADYYVKPIVRSGELPAHETVQSQGFYMQHDPRAHHVFAPDADGAA